MRSSRPPSPPPAPPPNSQLGRFTLVDRIAAGGMAEVFRAREPRGAGEPRLVVIKRMLPHIAAQPGARDMFEEEARLGSVVGHPNVVEVLEVGDADDQPFLALEYVPGVDLWRLTRFLAREGRRVDAPTAILIVRDLLAGLDAVHRARDERHQPLAIVHRDVSPSNVLLSAHGEVKLGDFGIARRLEASYHHGLGGRKGKLGYLAPEQAIGQQVDRRTDVFAAGVIAAELLMGRPLFTGGSELAILLAIRDANIQPLREMQSALPPGVVDALAEALARDPEERTASAEELRQRLAPFQDGDEGALRRGLGELVREAMGGYADEAGRVTLEIDGRGSASTPPSRIPQRADRELELTPSLEDGPQYHVRTEAGVHAGPWNYARIVQEISTGGLRPDDHVRVGEDRFRPIRDVAELAPHLPPSTRTPITGDASQAPEEPDLQLSMDGGQLIGALARAALEHETGLWLCEHGEIRKEVYVRLGVPEFVSSNLAGDLLGEYLVEHEVISRDELDMALAVLPRFEGRLGDTLIALGLAEPVELFQHMAEQVSNKLLDLFTWTSGRASFYRGVPPPTRGFPLGLQPWRILDAGIERRLACGLEEGRFRQRMTCSLARDAAEPDGHAGSLPDHARQVLQLLQRPRLLSDIADRAATPEDPRRGFRAVVLLLQLGCIRWVDDEAP